MCGSVPELRELPASGVSSASSPARESIEAVKGNAAFESARKALTKAGVLCGAPSRSPW
jgi:hypothetical protein